MFLNRSLWLAWICGATLMTTAADGDDWPTVYASQRAEAQRLSSQSLAVPRSPVQHQDSLEQRREQWREMLGLQPLPERTPLQATVTGTLDRGDYVVEKLHFQSIPGAYVAGNLYRPAEIREPLPAVLYLCGHSLGKVNEPYQANPRWFAQHGYVALVLDPIQLGESQGFHHGTYREQRWDWPSRGYTPAGAEVWNAMRALDYLESRPDVDASRLGVTGLSGGGVISWCLAAADERIQAVAPVCQSGSIAEVVADRGVDGHCDCAFWINYYRWDWPDIGALIAPRPLLIAAGSEDILWRPVGYRDAAHRIRRQYLELGAEEQFQLVEDWTPHGYTPKLRKAIFSWFNRHLKGDPTPVTDDVTDYVEPAENLLVFGGALPEQDRIAEIDQRLVQQAVRPEIRDAASWKAHQEAALRRLRETIFRHIAVAEQPQPHHVRADGSSRGTSFHSYGYTTDDDLRLSLKTARPVADSEPLPTLSFALPADSRSSFAGGGDARPRVGRGIATAAVAVRNTGVTSLGPGYLWTARRTYPLLGQTLPERQIADWSLANRLLRQQPGTASLSCYGEGSTAVLAIYTALLDAEVSELVLADLPASHEDPATPELLGVLRVGDLPHNLALAYPRPLTFVGKVPEAYQWTVDVYRQLGAEDRIRVVPRVGDWVPFDARSQ